MKIKRNTRVNETFMLLKLEFTSGAHDVSSIIWKESAKMEDRMRGVERIRFAPWMPCH